ncbi:hypothetical protein RHMOL_Rhmol04G0378000 [Rhododendron molle]|uniref:Uncharacterized protein n=1 Tax=Rhododendron molle TaxID=49168 RepID=A0ACC0P8Z7_RHOML|nr:hypothetical protein RHMOL_Rhmol04G0378000 [Rhododendron molle]
MAEKRFYYVVFVGRVSGIYNSWIACSEQVIHFSGAVFKKYPSLEEANNAWTAYVEAHSNVQLLSPHLLNSRLIIHLCSLRVHCNALSWSCNRNFNFVGHHLYFVLVDLCITKFLAWSEILLAVSLVIDMM